VILDVFSRYAVGWTVQHRESGEVAKDLIGQVCEQQHITSGRLTVHADRGSSMTSKPVAFLLADLGVLKTHNRPYTSTDNPYSEAQFKTLKYRPGFPARFDSIEHARAFCRDFFDWYNHEQPPLRDRPHDPPQRSITGAPRPSTPTAPTSSRPPTRRLPSASSAARRDHPPPPESTSPTTNGLQLINFSTTPSHPA
jgi:transposase InsO family protein